VQGKRWIVHIRPVGFKDRTEFMQAWNTINGSWNPDTIVTVYEFILVEKKEG
jgi:hypothetical protein